MKALHIFAVNGKSNSGDFFLGPSTKNKFEQIVGEHVAWTNHDVRKLVTEKDIQYYNNFDAIVIGGGGLLLPDTNPNIVSCWQWACSSKLIQKITSKIYVVGIGWNHFYGQNIAMPNRHNTMQFSERFKIFKDNMETLIEKSTFFTMRHNGDVEKLKEVVDQKYHEKIKFDFCPVIGYVEKKYKQSFSSGEYITFEIKDDRPNRRYIGTSIEDFYNTLFEFIAILRHQEEKIAVMSHDGSNSFVRFLKDRGFHDFIILNNTVANEEAIIKNYSKVKKLYCSAGHSQMTAFALGLDNYSLISHDKLLYFLQDTNQNIPEKGCLVKNLTLKTLLENN